MKDSRKILSLGLPILVSQLGGIVVGFADTFMVGRYSTEALASASFVNSVFNMVMFACIGFSYGMTPIVGALFSKGRQYRIGSVVRSGLIVNLIFALILTSLLAALYFYLDRMGQPANLLPTICPYFVLCTLGVVPATLFNMLAQWSYGINRTKMPMWIMLSCNLLNIILNWILIYGHLGMPEMGLAGAGIATMISRWAGFIAIALVALASPAFAEYRRGFARIGSSLRGLGQVFKISWPVSLQMTLESFSFSAAGIMAGWLGELELASFQIIVIVGTLGFCIYYSIGSATSVLVANEAGARDNSGMRRVAFAGYRIMLILATISSAIFWIFGPQLIHIFTDDAAVLAMTLGLIFPLVLYQYGDATQITFANALRGTSRVKIMSLIAFVSYVVVGLPATYILGFPCDLGIYGIILSFSVSLFLAAGLFLFFFMRYTKKPA